jgi:type I restriction enzyme, S subunit
MIDGLKPYPSMKKSGVPCLGEVPKHWKVEKLRNILEPVAERNRPDLPLLSVVREKGVIRRDITNKDENRNFIPDDLSNYKVVRAGQFAMNKMKAWQGSYGVSQHDGIVSPAYFVFEVSGVEGAFLHLAIRCRAYVSFFGQASDGVRIGQWDLSQTRMKEIPFFVPPLSEQSAIVLFLDHADRRIRRYIRAKQKLIKLLEEEKQAIVHRIIVHGLDPNGRLKPSGVEWLGDIPEHWKVKRGKYLFREVDHRSTTGTEELLSLRMYQGLVPHKQVSATPISAEALVGYKKAEPGQIVMNRMRAAIGMFGIAHQPGLVSPDYAVLEANEWVRAEYFVHLFKTRAAGTVFRLESKGLGTGSSGFMRLYTDRFGTIKFPVPPKEEQNLIVRGIKDETQKIERTQERVNREISLLRELHSRLIADVVTGKLDVREAAARLPEAAPDVEPLDEMEDVPEDEGAVDEELEAADVA